MLTISAFPVKCALSFRQVFWPNSDFLGLADRSNSYLVLNIHRINGEPVLVFMYGGSFAKSMEDWHDQDIVSDCLRVLGRICQVKPVPKPIDYHITRWGKELFSEMAFTYIPPGVPAKENLRAMSQPILDFAGEKPVLQFAGEHTTPFHPSTIHGAFLSGIREAYRLDCAVDPDGMDGLVFSEDDVYEPTFKLPSQKKASSAIPTETVENSREMMLDSSRSHRSRRGRRSAACVMRFHPQPMDSTLQNANQIGISSDNMNLQNRYRFGRLSKSKALTSSVAEIRGEEKLNDCTALEALEDRTLIRCMESFGNDYEYICDIALPIYGDERARNLPQIRQRCRKLLQQRKKLAGWSRASKKIRKLWFSSNTDENP